MNVDAVEAEVRAFRRAPTTEQLAVFAGIQADGGGLMAAQSGTDAHRLAVALVPHVPLDQRWVAALWSAPTELIDAVAKRHPRVREHLFQAPLRYAIRRARSLGDAKTEAALCKMVRSMPPADATLLAMLATEEAPERTAHTFLA